MNDAIQRARRRLLVGGASAVLAPLAGLAPQAARAQDKGFPVRPIRFVVPFGAGSGTDIVARIYAKAVGDVIGQPVVVDNKAGANGIIGAKAVLGSEADGYTVFFASNSTLTTNAALYRDLPYDPVRDFEAVSLLDGSYCVVAVPASSPYRTLADLLADARKRPRALNHAAGSPTYALWNGWLDDIARIRTTNIFYKGSGEAANATMSGQVDYAIIGTGTALPLVKGNRLRALLYTGKTRHAQLPGVPTAAESGLAGYQALAWSAVAVRAGTPAPIVRRLEAIIREAARKPEVQRGLAQLGSEPLYGDAAAMRRFQLDEIARWKRLIASTGITIE